MASIPIPGQPKRVKASEGADAILKPWYEEGGCIIEGIFTPDQMRRMREEIKPILDGVIPGTRLDDEELQAFHGNNTKRLTGLVAHSKTFREEILDSDLVHEICEKIFKKDSGSHWLGTGQIIQIGPGNPVQGMHRDQWQYPIFTHAGPNAPAASVNFFTAVTEFTRENGATRVILGSHKWADQWDLGREEDCVFAEMQCGDVFLINGKVAHGGGANVTEDFHRIGLAMNFTPSYITSEEASPFLIPSKIVEQCSPRVQSMIGFRAQFPSEGPGLWKLDYSDVMDHVMYRVKA